MALSIEDWKYEAFAYLGMRLSELDEFPPPNDSSPMKLKTDPRPGRLPNVKFSGDKRPKTGLGKQVIDNIWGSERDRHKISPESKKAIEDQRALGTAAPVTIASNGKELHGNFFSAGGHNLKEHDFAPDVKRPVALLLTGSGGSAEDQGLKLAQFYQGKGASVMSVNYAGFGSSEDTDANEVGLYKDAQEMLNYVIGMGYTPADIIVHGYSMGGAVAATLVQRNEKNGVKFRATVFDRPMTSTKDAVRETSEAKDHFLSSGIVGSVASMFGGDFQTKDRMKKIDKDLRKVVTLDNEDLGPYGEAMRLLLEQKGHNVSNPLTPQQDRGGHFDHDTMLMNNEKALEDLLKKDSAGRTTDLAPTSDEELADMITLAKTMKDFDDVNKKIMDGYSRMSGIPTLLRGTGKVDDCKSFARDCIETANLILDLNNCGILNADAFAREANLYKVIEQLIEQTLEKIDTRIVELDPGVVRELALDALDDLDNIDTHFQDPGPDDPLGTHAMLPKTILGKAIEAARKGRSTDYEWGDIEDLRESDSSAFERIIRAERETVLGMVRPA